MKIVNDFPPNFDEIARTFDLEDLKPVFAYGDTLYNPSGGPISEDLMAHEETHSRQQAALGLHDWWARYLKDDGFRLSQEVEAYREQYKYAKKHYHREARRWTLNAIVKNLASKLYGKIVNKKQAKELIEDYE